MAEVPDFLPAQWLWNAHHPDVPLFCFLRLRREPVFRVIRIASEAGQVVVTLEYGAAEARFTTREVFTLTHQRHGGLAVTDRRPG